jgi:hypothetical protein
MDSKGPASVVNIADEDVKQVSLSGGERFPAAVTLVKLDAYGVAKQLSKTSQHAFSIDRQLLAERLRLIATLVEEGKVLPQKVAFTSSAVVEDFTLTTLEFVFAEKVVAQAPAVVPPTQTMVAR